jgi:hypothetical protein
MYSISSKRCGADAAVPDGLHAFQADRDGDLVALPWLRLVADGDEPASPHPAVPAAENWGRVPRTA